MYVEVRTLFSSHTFAWIRAWPKSKRMNTALSRSPSVANDHSAGGYTVNSLHPVLNTSDIALARDLCSRGVKRIALHTRVYGSRRLAVRSRPEFCPYRASIPIGQNSGDASSSKEDLLGRAIFLERSPLMFLHGGSASSLNDVMITKWVPRWYRVGDTWLAKS